MGNLNSEDNDSMISWKTDEKEFNSEWTLLFHPCSSSIGAKGWWFLTPFFSQFGAPQLGGR